MGPAVFLDRDGTLIEERDYLRHPDEVSLLPGAGVALQKLQAAGFKLIIVSNQSGVGRGYFSMADVDAVNARVREEFARFGATFDKIYIAPEAPGQPGRGRKPSPAFLFDARDELGVDLPSSHMIGDKLIDLECGWNAGLKRCWLVRTGYGKQTEELGDPRLARSGIVDNLAQAAGLILGSGG